MAWHRALGRQGRDDATVEAGLRAALDARGLGKWIVRRYDFARDAWAARDARAAWDARDARAARAARDAWAAWDAWAAGAARDARDALVTQYTVRRGWITASPDRHTVGIRDAHKNGLGIALPTGPNELGWAMDEVGL
jgi:hypothetical protein